MLKGRFMFLVRLDDTTEGKWTRCSRRALNRCAFASSVELVIRHDDTVCCCAPVACFFFLPSVTSCRDAFTNINHCWQTISSMSKSFKRPPKGQGASNTSERDTSADTDYLLSKQPLQWQWSSTRQTNAGPRRPRRPGTVFIWIQSRDERMRKQRYSSVQ